MPEPLPATAYGSQIIYNEAFGSYQDFPYDERILANINKAE